MAHSLPRNSLKNWALRSYFPKLPMFSCANDSPLCMKPSMSEIRTGVSILHLCSLLRVIWKHRGRWSVGKRPLKKSSGIVHFLDGNSGHFPLPAVKFSTLCLASDVLRARKNEMLADG